MSGVTELMIMNPEFLQRKLCSFEIADRAQHEADHFADEVAGTGPWRHVRRHRRRRGDIPRSELDCQMPMGWMLDSRPNQTSELSII